MNTRPWGIAIVLVICAAAIGCVTYQYPPSSNRPVVTDVAPAGGSDQPFYDDLEPYGRWVNVSGPGWVWSPYNVQAGWRPYQLGHWVFTDYGWTWSSDEQWGWAVYHYGRWDHNSTYGWVWVPGTEWGPAWVAWHEGGGFVGWAPLPWQVRFRAEVGLDWGSVNVSIDPSWWCFVGERNLVDPGLRNVIVPATRNVALIQITRNVTNYTYIDNRVVNQGVRVEKIGRAVGRTIPRYRVMDDDSPGVGRGGKVRGQDFIVFRPDAKHDHKSEGRDAPRGRDRQDQQDRARDIRRAAEEDRQQLTPPPAQPERTTTNPPSPPEPPAPPPGRETKDDDHKSRQSRGRRFMDEMMRKQPPHNRAPEKPSPTTTPPQGQDQPSTAAPQHSGESAPPAEARPDSAPTGDRHDATTPPARPDPEKARTGRDRSKDVRDAAARGRKQKPDAAKADDKKDDKKQDDPKQEKHDSEN